MRPTLLLLAVLAGCTPSAKGFGDASIKLSCNRIEECNKADFDANFSSQSDCNESLSKNSSKVTDCQAAACDYNAKAAGKCLSGVKKQSCEDFNSITISDCNNVYTNCNNTALATCLADAGFTFDTGN